MTVTADEDLTLRKRNRSGTPAEPEAADTIGNRARAGVPPRPRVGAKTEDPAPVPLPRSTNPLRHAGRWVRRMGARLKKCAPYTDRPASIRDVVRYTMAGGWIPGDHPWWWEAPGYVFGFVIAIPAAVIGNATLHVTHKPFRTAVAFLAYGLLCWAGIGFLVQVPVRLFAHALLWMVNPKIVAEIPTIPADWIALAEAALFLGCFLVVMRGRSGR